MSGMEEAEPVARRPLKCLEISPTGFRAVVIEPGHPEYEEILRRDEEASQCLDRFDFEAKAVRGFWSTLLWL